MNKTDLILLKYIEKKQNNFDEYELTEDDLNENELTSFHPICLLNAKAITKGFHVLR